MYPRQESSRSRSTASRNQLADLLINKFRIRFKVNLNTEKDLDRIVVDEVTKLIKKDSSVSEKDLHMIERVIKQAV